MSDQLKLLQEKLGYTFKDSALLTLAITHRSKHKTDNNERLEFLGDAVLSLVISNALFDRYPNAREGELSRLRAALVKGETIAQLSLELGIDQVLKLGAGESKSGGAQRTSILAGAFEGVLGAIYKDAGLDIVSSVILRCYGDRLYNVESVTDVKDAKSCLQEWLQAQHLPLPDYEVKTAGRAHEQTFDVICRVDGFSEVGQGQSTSRRKAEQLAAKAFLEKVDAK